MALTFTERLARKLRRRFRKPFNKVVHGERFFVTRYFGADFLVRGIDVGGLEISAGIGERSEIENFIAACRRRKPDLFLDIGANIGLYSNILLRQDLVPRAVLFEPDRRNQVRLRANLLINGVLDRAEIREMAAGAAPGRFHLVPGPETDIGLSRIVEATTTEGYEVEVVRLDDVLDLSGRTLAIKMDIERYERPALRGMAGLLRANRGIMQIEAFESRDEVVAMMRDLGWPLVWELEPNLVFEKG